MNTARGRGDGSTDHPGFVVGGSLDGAPRSDTPIDDGWFNAPADWDRLDLGEVEVRLATGPGGLDGAEADRRRGVVGPNALEEEPPAGVFALLVHQFKSPLIYILVVAAAVTVLLEEYIDAAVIVAVLVLNAAIGYYQERRADDAVRALMGLVAPQAHVVRQGREQMIAGADVVPGDVALLESGGRVPADIRLATATELRIDEALLTGESDAVAKLTAPALGEDAGGRATMAYSGTVVASGRGSGYVVATGGSTELGAIAKMVREEKEPQTPLQRRMVVFSRVVGIAVAVSAALTMVIGVVAGRSLSDMFLVAVALAVSAIPEGLPVVFTITLAIGVSRMARRKAMIRNLPAVETLGSVTVIGSDKTGTLTENRMTVEALWVAGGDGGSSAATVSPGTPMYRTLLAGVLASEASLTMNEGELEGHGDPTEVALLMAADHKGLDIDELRRRHRSVREVPFESDRQYSASFRSEGDDVTVHVKGAPERVIAMCGSVDTVDGPSPIDRDEIAAAAERMAGGGLRVLAMAYRTGVDPESGPDSHGGVGAGSLVLAGLQGMMDPPRAGVPEAIAGCRRSGIRVIMITGDHAATATAIGHRIGLDAEAGALTGSDLDVMDDDELRESVASTGIYARVSPAHKLRVVRALQATEAVVAVTGDGVNDAPALKASDVGVAMGKGGTDVAREASDMVIADDDFVSIYAAVEAGRVTFDNLRKATFYLVSSGAGEVLAVLVALWLGWPLPFLPAQILWLNLVTNGLQDVALAFEPADRGVLDRPPRPRGEGILSATSWQGVVISGVVMAAGTIVMFRWVLDESGSLMQAQTAALTTMVLFQVFHAGNSRSEKTSVLRISPFSNRFLLLASAGALGLHIAAMYLPLTRTVLRIEPIAAATWPTMIAVAASIVVVMEVFKLVLRHRTG